jgi:hypothetical protein
MPKLLKMPLNFSGSVPLMKIIKKSPIKTSPQYLATGHSENQTIKPLESVEKETMPEEKPQTPQEWLKPKIFKGSGLI